MKNFKFIQIINLICILFILYELIVFSLIFLFCLGYYYPLMLINNLFPIEHSYTEIVCIIFLIAEIILFIEKFKFKKYYFSYLPDKIRKFFTIILFIGLIISFIFIIIYYFVPVV